MALTTVDGALLGTNATPQLNGVQFPATQVPSANANTLDDYEEGTFTPTLGGSGSNPTVSYANRVGAYTKIGRLVHIQVKMTGGVKSTAISGYLEGVPISIVTEGTGSVSDSGVADHGNCLFANTDRIWLTDTSLGTGTVYISGCYLTT